MQTAPILLQQVFSDADHFCEAGEGWDVEFRQLDRGSLSASMDVVVAPGLTVQRLHLDRRFHQRGCSPKGTLTFGLPDHSRIISWYGKPMPCATLVNFNSRDGYDSVSERDFAAQTFSIAEDLFQDAAAVLGIDIDIEQIIRAPGNIHAAPIDLERIREAADKIFTDSAFGSASAGFANNELQDELVLAMVSANGRLDSCPFERRYSQRQRVVNRALEYINSRGDAIAVSDLYRVSGSSWRTLDRGFQERFGLTPRRYIAASRMIGAKRSLLAAPPESRIADIANDWGFSHLGRFSIDYKQMFGERPSDTLRA
jgi:AraC family ethanolamine operon transcriptional activator